MLERMATIVEGCGIDGVLGKPVADGDDRDTPLKAQVEELPVDAQLVTIHEAAPVDVEEQGMWAGTGGRVEVHDIALVRTICDVNAVRAEFAGLFGVGQ